ncbi:MAG: hypothetical protein HY064_12640 [Bacteroidetes bacterium]|nr:hypothetical protein [Bacteroidota bacterium]
MKKFTLFLGWIGLIFGITTAVCAPLPGWGTPIAFFSMLPGFLCSSLYVLFSSRDEVNTGWFNPGYWGMFLSSTPLILLIYFKFLR